MIFLPYFFMKQKHRILASALATMAMVAMASPVAGARDTTSHDPFTHNGTMGHFTWGVDLGSGLDLTAHDMTNMNISACFGYKGNWIRFAGVGAEIMSMVNNSSRCYPVYAQLRTSFSHYPRLCFLEARAGVAFSSIMDYKAQTDFYGSLGIGFTLAHSNKFSSHMVLRGVVMPLQAVETDGYKQLNYVAGYAFIGIGCAF